MQHPADHETLSGVADYAAFVLDAFAAAPYELDLGTGAFGPSPRLNTLFGYAEQQPLTLDDCRSRYHPDDQSTLVPIVSEALNGGDLRFTRSFRIVLPDGAVHWLLSRGELLLGAHSQPVGVRGVVMDITERKQAEQDLLASQARLRLALEIAELGTWSWHLTSGAGDLDDRGAAIVGLPPGKFASAPAAQRERVHPDDLAQLERDIGAGVAAGRVFNMMYRVVHPDGSIHHVLSRARVLADEAGRPIQLVGTNRDVTAEREAEAALRANEERYRELYAQEQASRAEAEQANRLKDDFLATVSHELRTPLTALLGYAELLQRRKRDEAYVARTVEKIVQSARAQAALVDDLLDISRIVSGKLRIDPGRLALTDVVYAALDTVRPTIEAKGQSVEVDIDQAASVVLGDVRRLQQVVWNLLANAAKFTPRGGRIEVQLARAGNDAELRISDTGQGIRPEFLPYIFERFRQADSSSHRKYGGLGIGLAIVRHLVELHGGTVEAASVGEGQGATFLVRLPLAAGERAGQLQIRPGDAEVGAAPIALRGLRVLVVEDEPAILDLLAEYLSLEGAAVRACASAQDALGLVPAWRPDVLVSDIAMPGEDGYWLIEHVRQLAPEQGGATPAIALTAYARIEDRLRVLAVGFQQYLPKPVETSELRNAILSLVAV